MSIRTGLPLFNAVVTSAITAANLPASSAAPDLVPAGALSLSHAGQGLTLRMDAEAASLPCALAPVPQHCQVSLAGGMEGLRMRCKTTTCEEDPSKAFACGDVPSMGDGLAATASACEAPLPPGSPMQPCSPQLVPAPLRSGHFSPGPCGSGSATQDGLQRAQTIADAEHSSLVQRKRRGCDARSDQLCDLVADARAALKQAAASAQQQPTQTLKRVCSGLSAATTTTTTSSLADAGGGLSRLRGATSLPVAIPGCSSGQVSLCAGTWLLGSTQSLSSLQSSPPAGTGTAACRASKRCSSKAQAAAAAAAAADEEHGPAAAGAKGGRRTLSRSRSNKGSSQSSGSRRSSRAGEKAGKGGSQAAGTPSASGASSSGAGSTGQPAVRGPRLRLGGRLLTAEEAAAHLKAAAEAAAKAAAAAAAAQQQQQQQQQQLAAHSAASSEAPAAGTSHVGGSRTASPLSASSVLDLGRSFGSVIRLPSQPICVGAAAKQQQHWALAQQSPFLACDLQSLLQHQDSCNTGAAGCAGSGEAAGCDDAVVSSMCVDLPENFIPTPDQAGPWQTLASTLATDDDCSLLQQLQQQQGPTQQRPQQQLAAAVLTAPTPPAAAQLAAAHGLVKMESGQFVSPFVHGPGPLAADVGSAAAAGQQQMCVGLGLAPWCSSSDPAGGAAADSGSHVVLLRPEPVRPTAWLPRAGTGSFASSSSPAGSASIAIPGRGASDASLAAAASSSASQECGAEQAVDLELHQLLQAWSPAPPAAPAAVDSNGCSATAQHSGFCPLTLKVQQQQQATAAPRQQLPAWRSAFAAASRSTTEEAAAAAGHASAFTPATSCMVPTPGALAFGNTSAAGTGGFAPPPATGIQQPAAGVATDGLPPPQQQQLSCSVAQDSGTQPRPCATRRVRVVLGAGGPTAMIDPPPPSSGSPVPHFATPAAAAAAAGGALPADARVVSSLQLRALVDGLVAQRAGPSAFRSCCPGRQNGAPLDAGGGARQPLHEVLDGQLAGAAAGQGLAAPSSVMVDGILPSMQDLLTDCC